MSVAGKATIGGTQAYSQSLPMPKQAWRLLGRTGWRVSAIGFGTFHSGVTDPVHRATLEKALHSGINLIDTSPTFLDGEAESLIGELLTHLVVWEDLNREALVIVDKVGYIQGSHLERVRALAEAGQGFPEVVEVAPDHWHCMHPSFIEDQLTLSLSRMHLDCLDVYLLHDPEYVLQQLLAQGLPLDEARRTFYLRIKQAFLALEKLVKEGLIQYYGISSNGLVLPQTDARHLSLAGVWRVYQDVCLQLGMGVEQGHFGFIQVPFNLLERGALEERNNLWQGQTWSVLELAGQFQLAVLAHRPLQAFDGRQWVQLPSKLSNREDLSGPLQALLKVPLPDPASEQQAAELALRFSLSAPGVSAVITGMPRPPHVDQALRVLQTPFLERQASSGHGDG